MLPIQLHRLLADLLAAFRLPLVLRLERLDLRLERLLGLHRADLLDSERQQQHPDGDGEKDDGHPVVRDQLVHEREDLPQAIEDRLHPHDGDHAVFSGMTSSYTRRRIGGWSTPPADSGEQRRTRHTARTTPRAAPNSATARSA